MTARAMNSLLDKLLAGALKPEDRDALIKNLQDIEKDNTRSPGDRMAAILMRAALEVRSIHVG